MKLKHFAFIECFIFYLRLSKADENIYWTNDESCGVTEPNSETNFIHQGQWPFLAAIFHIVDSRVYFVCGGTIISNYVVLTGKTRSLIFSVFQNIFFNSCTLHDKQGRKCCEVSRGSENSSWCFQLDKFFRERKHFFVSIESDCAPRLEPTKSKLRR